MDEQRIKKSIEKQSFQNRKDGFIKNNNASQVSFLRVGKKEQWRDGLSEKYKKMPKMGAQFETFSMKL